jgi:aspartyl aminopeptidase
LRDAAAIVVESDRPVALIPRLMSDLAKIANTTTDANTQRRLRRLLGEAQ